MITHETATPTLPRIGDTAPDFTVPSTHGELRFHEWAGDSWVVLFSHPADFTPVCSTELTAFGQRNDEFAQRNVKLLGLSVDSIHSHLAWTQNLSKILDTRLPFPLVADSDRAVAELYGMIHANESATVTVRALFVIDPKHTIRTVIYYPLNVGRNIDEVLRVVDALQTAETNSVACPANWSPGDPVIIPPPKTENEVDQRMADTGLDRLDFYLCRRRL